MENSGGFANVTQHTTVIIQQGYEPRIGSYRMDLAYVFVPIFILLICFFFILRTIAHSIGTLDNASSLVRTVRTFP